MDPITMNANNDKSTVLNVDSGVLRINYAGGENSEDAIVRANNPIPSQCEMFYFEVDIINNEKNGIIAIGFCEQSVELNKLPGCGNNSWGYHSDDGNFFDSSEVEEPYGPEFKTGDTIGCCLNFRNHTVFYTKNGVNLGIAFRDLKDKNDLEKGSYYPCIGMRSDCGPISIEVNFGNKKFKYIAIADDDIDDQLKEKWVKVLKHCNEDTIKDFMDKLNSMEINQKNMLECRAKVYFIIGSYKEALDDLNKLLKMEENSVFALRYRRETYFLLCEQKQSNADLKRLLKKDDKWALQVNEEINGDRRKTDTAAVAVFSLMRKRMNMNLDSEFTTFFIKAERARERTLFLKNYAARSFAS